MAALTTGFSGADLAKSSSTRQLGRDPAQGAGRGLQDFTAAIERIVAGLEKKSRVPQSKGAGNRRLSRDGHALVALALPGTDRYTRFQSFRVASVHSATPCSGPPMTGF